MAARTASIGSYRGVSDLDPQPHPFLGFLTRPIEGWVALILLLTITWCLGHSVQEAEFVPHLEPLIPMGFGAVVFGWLAAQSNLRPRMAHVLSGVLACELTIAVYAATLPPAPWQYRVNDLLYRVNIWFQAAFAGGNNRDNLMFALAMALLIWVLGYTASWLVFRRQLGWVAVGLTLTAQLVHLSYSYQTLNYHFYVQLFASFLLLARIELAQRERFWARARLEVQGSVRRNVVVVSSLAILVAMLLANRAPAEQPTDVLEPAWARVSDTIQRGQSTFDRLFGGVQGPPTVVVGLAFSGTLQPREGFELGTSPVLKIEAPRARYWRTTTYDVYTGQGIASGQVYGDRFEAGQPIPVPFGAGEAREEMEQTITVLAPQSNLVFAADAPIRVSVPTLFEWRDEQFDLAALRLTQLIRRGQQYSVLSAASIATEQQLSGAGTDYPAGIERYLQLPESVPPRVKQAAAELTAQAENPYQKALAIESYLRDLKYDTHVSPPPPDRDWVDYTLFDAKAGYSDYLATSMTVMLRSVGVPARVVSGFAPGEFDENEAAIIVYESEAHSWVEVFFPRYGWINFEPSALRALPFRPTDENPIEPIGALGGGDYGDTLDPFFEDFGEYLSDAGFSLPERRDLAWVEALGYLAAVLVIAGLAYWIVLSLFRRGIRGLPWHSQWYAQLRRLAAWGGLAGPASQTPHEYTSWLDSRLPGSGRVVRPIADCYVEGTYSGHSPGPETLAKAAAAWEEARGPLARRVLLRGVIATQDRVQRLWEQVSKRRAA
ncbi:MAG: transglutaminaseTgpA domain-containing protein [Chloroflexota bacterium]